MNTINFEGKACTPSKVLCVGKNYDKHIKEMGSKRPDKPVIFIKPNSSIAPDREKIFIPEHLGLLHHEVELCVLIGQRLKEAQPEKAARAILGAAVGIDFTLRDLQNELKQSACPWELSKGFDCSAVFGDFASKEDFAGLNISLEINSKVRQSSSTSFMIFSPCEVISYVSRFITVEEGDILMLGTPEGVGEVKHGDTIKAYIDGLPDLKFSVARY